ncbi:MAG: Holliday junction branch migration protein RuvA [Candidatus Aminicenantes bacterium]|nr:Holliday junction branch migration protein RuvA [Candidatus Aminicenantes bacterium]
MIAYLKGNLIQKKTNQFIIDCNGVGYQAYVPLSTYLKAGEPGDPVTILIYTHMTDNSLTLFGFSTEEEKELFLKLITISGIGPKIALNILSGIGVSDLEEAISQGDIARISLIPGIGKKTAMRIALELQEKLALKQKILKSSSMQEREDLISAFMNMGFKRKEVEIIVDEAIKTYTLEAGLDILLREGLKLLAKI